MHPVLRTLIMAAVLAGGTTPGAGAASDATPTAEKIVARYVDARGGLQGWQKVHSMAWNGHVESTEAASAQAPFTLLFRRPNAARFELTVEGRPSVRLFDGSRGWKVRASGSGKMAVEEYSAEELQFARDAAGLDGPLVDYRNKGVSVGLQGSDEVEGHKAYRLGVTLPSGAVHQVWIDAQSFLELKYARTAQLPSGAIGTVLVYYRDYRTVNGLTLPMIIETGDATGQHSNRMIIERVAFNPPVDDAAFAPPMPHRGRATGLIRTTPAGH